MLEALTAILLFQLLGEALAYLLKLPLPGPVIGMAGLFIAWPYLSRIRAAIEQVSGALLANLGLLFVPAGVGVMLHAGLIVRWWLPLLLAVLLSTAISMAISALLFDWLQRRKRRTP